MDQKHRQALVKKYEDGIIDHYSTDYEKYGILSPMTYSYFN